MSIPGFTAENSVGPTIQTYRVHHYPGAAGALLSPQQVDLDEAVEDAEDVENGEAGMSEEMTDQAIEEEEEDAAEEEDSSGGEE